MGFNSSLVSRCHTGKENLDNWPIDRLGNQAANEDKLPLTP